MSRGLAPIKRLFRYMYENGDGSAVMLEHKGRDLKKAQHSSL